MRRGTSRPPATAHSTVSTFLAMDGMFHRIFRFSSSLFHQRKDGTYRHGHEIREILFPRPTFVHRRPSRSARFLPSSRSARRGVRDHAHLLSKAVFLGDFGGHGGAVRLLFSSFFGVEELTRQQPPRPHRIVLRSSRGGCCFVTMRVVCDDARRSPPQERSSLEFQKDVSRSVFDRENLPFDPSLSKGRRAPFSHGNERRGNGGDAGRHSEILPICYCLS